MLKAEVIPFNYKIRIPVVTNKSIQHGIREKYLILKWIQPADMMHASFTV
jgi:hypothetical protein